MAIKTDGTGALNMLPMLICDGLKGHAQHILIVTLYGVLLEKHFNTNITKGIILAGEKPAKIVTLKSRSSIFEAWLKDLIKARLSPSVPPLLLNDHCSVCE